jgi:hypothetical protein
MMDLVHPWLDPAEVRRMAERLLAPVQEQAVPVQDAEFGECFVGFDQVPVPVPLVATEPVAALKPVPLGQSDVEPRLEVRGPFLDRITGFRDWLRDHFQAVGVFLMDQDGTVIFDEGGHGKLHCLATSLAASSRRPGAITGNVHIKVGASATLELIPTGTPDGCVILGAVVPEPLDPASIQMILEALGAVAGLQR